MIVIPIAVIVTIVGSMLMTACKPQLQTAETILVDSEKVIEDVEKIEGDIEK